MMYYYQGRDYPDADSAIQALGKDCASEAFLQGAKEGDEIDLTPNLPIGGDWDALSDLLERDPSKDEIELFERSYSREMSIQKQIARDNA